jgi:hypothetical protein
LARIGQARLGELRCGAVRTGAALVRRGYAPLFESMLMSLGLYHRRTNPVTSLEMIGALVTAFHVPMFQPMSGEAKGSTAMAKRSSKKRV